MTLAGRRSPVAVAAIVVLFFAARLPLLAVRQPFFDELFTQWIAAKSFAGILHALHSDSGPPLYYFAVHVFGHARIVSLVCAAIALGALLYEQELAAALLVALFPPSVLFAADGRSYAMCAMFVAFGVLAARRERPYLAAFSFVFAAYSHYYGVLFFPIARRVKAAVVYLLFLPGIWLALRQPREAIAWMHHFAYPDALFVRPPVLLLVAMIGLAIASVPGWLTVLVPYALSIPIYVPLRFESVVANPLMLSIGRRGRWIVFPLAACFGTWTLIGIVDHAHRPVDDYRDAALHLPPGPVVASGYLYLESAVLRPNVSAFPEQQAQHPGWRAIATTGSGLPRGAFVWIGERNAPELSIIRQTRAVQPLYANARAIIVRVN